MSTMNIYLTCVYIKLRDVRHIYVHIDTFMWDLFMDAQYVDRKIWLEANIKNLNLRIWFFLIWLSFILKPSCIIYLLT